MQASGLTLLATLSSLRTVSPGTKLFTDSHLRWHARCNLTESRRMPTTGMKVRLIPWEETMGLTKQLLVGLAALGACSAYSVVASAQNANDGKVVIGAQIGRASCRERVCQNV